MIMPEHEEAIDSYRDALKEIGADLSEYTFKIQDNRIRIGHVDEGFVQWSMTWYTPAEFKRMARARKQNLTKGDPRKG